MKPLWSILLTSMLCGWPVAQLVSPTNPGFEEGADGKPAGWTLSGGQGGWATPGHDSTHCVSVVSEAGNSFWRSADLVFEPGGLYRVSVWMRAAAGTTGGCVVTGPGFANRDFDVGDRWEERSFVFSVPDAPRNTGFLRFGQWEKTGTVYFDDVRLVPVQPVHQWTGGPELGAGESVEHGQYLAQLRLDGEGSNSSRCLYRSNAGFNSNRWILSGDASVIYRHRVGEYEQTSARCKINCGWFESGVLVAEASRDGQNWSEIGRVDRIGQIDAPIPEGLFPAPEVYIRLRGEGDTNLQVHGYEYFADLTGDPPDLRGATMLFELLYPGDDIHLASVGNLTPGGENWVSLLAGPQALPQGGIAQVDVQGARGVRSTEAQVAPRSASVRLAYEVRDAGQQTVRIAILPSRGAPPLFLAEARLNVPDMYAADYGYLVSQDSTASVWWCESPYKVSRERPVPEERRALVVIDAARNEYEAAQVVVRPMGDLVGLTATVTDLTGPRGAKIAASDIEIDEVAYLNVRVPTDSTGCEGWWPDPLPPLKAPIDVAAGRNQPLWITAHVPKDIPGGNYQGTLTLSAQGWQSKVSLRVHVFDFALPDETHVESGFGLDAGPLREYHNLETNEEVRQVYDLYLRNFAAHRISPYNPTPFDPIRVSFTGITWEGGKAVTDEKATGTTSLKIVDDTDTGVISAATRELIPIDRQEGHVLSWSCLTMEPNQEYLVTLQTYDANRQWISGNNKDFGATGNGDWQREERDLSGRFDDRVRYVRLILRPAMWTEDGQKMGTAWFDDCELVEGDDGKNLIPNPGFETTDEQLDVEVDFTDWDRAAQYAFDELHLRNFALPVQGMGGGTFHSRHLGRIGPYEQGTPGYERLMTKYLMAVQNHLEEKGWLDRQYIYWFDEPDPKDYDFVRDGMDLLKRCAPKLRRMLTEEPIQPLFGAVDLWCPVLPNMDPTACAARKKAGEDVWWYVCTGPKAPYPTLFIDHSAIEMRIWLWMTWKWNLDGVLIWATNYWHSPAAYYQGKLQNPWEDPMSYVSGYDYKPGQVAYWGNGDGRFLYPPNRKVGDDKAKYLEGPVSCIRWEMLRDGIEDYECLYLLRSLTEKGGAKAQEAAKLLEIPEAIIPDATHFSRDPLPMLEHRRKVAEVIEGLK
jgi:hypothetical protein